MNFEKKNWVKDKILFLKMLKDKYLGRLWEDKERQEKWKKEREDLWDPGQMWEWKTDSAAREQ